MTGAVVGGLVLTAGVTAALVAGFGRAALVPGLAFGVLATVIQGVSASLVRPAAKGEFTALIKRWGMGMGMRVGGIVVFGVASGLDPIRFPPIPTAFAYLGVVVPLLFLEIRFLR